MEYELLDTGIFNDNRYWDVFVEFAKQTAEDVLIQITVCNRGPEAATSACAADAVVSQYLDLVGREPEAPLEAGGRPAREVSGWPHRMQILGDRYLYCEGEVPLLFTENETNTERIFGTPNATRLRERRDSTITLFTENRMPLIRKQTGTKAAAHYQVNVGRRADGDYSFATERYCAAADGRSVQGFRQDRHGAQARGR